MFMSFFEKSHTADLYIDLGTSNVLITIKDQPDVINEPSLIAYSELSPGKRKIVAVGAEAREKVEKTPGNIFASRPLVAGAVTDLEITEAMIRHYLSRPKVKSRFSRPRVIMSVPYGVTEVEREALRKAGLAAGAREVYLVDEPIVSAIGAGLPISEAKGSMIVDLGGGSTEVGVMALADIVFCRSIRIGGHSMDEEIVQFMRNSKGLVITEAVAESIKKTVGTATPKVDVKTTQAHGRDTHTGLTRTTSVNSQEIGEAIQGCVQQIIRAIQETLENIPPELVSDVIDRGLYLSGGGAMLANLGKKIELEVKLPVKIVSHPQMTMAEGGRQLLKDPSLLERVCRKKNHEETLLDP
jgi:rod shape-determining protein MreB